LRSAGVVLILPALMLYLYGPREDRAPDFARARRFAERVRRHESDRFFVRPPEERERQRSRRDVLRHRKIPRLVP